MNEVPQEDLGLRREVLSRMEKFPKDCSLFDELTGKVADQSPFADDYEIATYRLLVAIHNPYCTNLKHQTFMLETFGEG